MKKVDIWKEITDEKIDDISKKMDKGTNPNYITPVHRCYDCQRVCTKDYKYIDIFSEDGNLMRVAIHNACHKRALEGGNPISPETAPN